MGSLPGGDRALLLPLRASTEKTASHRTLAPRTPARLSPFCSLLTTVPHAVAVANPCTPQGLELFDNALLGMSESEAQVMDPQQRLLLQTGLDAWMGADPGCRALASSAGVFVGIMKVGAKFSVYP